jgi:Domain of unknown function (DUF4149)
MPAIGRAAALLAGVWAGVLLCIGAIAAPALFASLVPAEAGRVAGRMFEIEAYASLGAAFVLLLVERWRSRDAARVGTGSIFSVDLMLVLAALFCTVAGYFAVQPMMVAARAGQSSVSFATLHAVSGGFFVLKGLLVLALAWRLAALKTTATTS